MQERRGQGRSQLDPRPVLVIASAYVDRSFPPRLYVRCRTYIHIQQPRHRESTRRPGQIRFIPSIFYFLNKVPAPPTAVQLTADVLSPQFPHFSAQTLGLYCTMLSHKPSSIIECCILHTYIPYVAGRLDTVRKRKRKTEGPSLPS